MALMSRRSAGLALAALLAVAPRAGAQDSGIPVGSKAPGAIVAAKMEQDKVALTHLVCPYPQSAQFKGGDANDAASYECRASGARP